MNVNIACSILNIKIPFNKEELRKAYMISALEYHPDKNNNPDATAIFQNITEAYTYLNENIDFYELNNNNNDNNNDISYIELIQKFINLSFKKFNNTEYNSEEYTKLIHCFQNNCKNFSLKVIENFDQKNLIKIWEYINLYKNFLNINDETFNKIENIIQDKLKNDSIIILNPTISNILNNDTFKLLYEDQEFYVPLWKDNLFYSLSDISNNMLFIKCIPDLSNNITIERGTLSDNIHINIYKSINEIINQDISIKLTNKKILNIKTENLKIKNYQKFIFKNEGIPYLNNNLDVITYGDIIIHIYINFRD